MQYLTGCKVDLLMILIWALKLLNLLIVKLNPEPVCTFEILDFVFYVRLLLGLKNLANLTIIDMRLLSFYFLNNQIIFWNLLCLKILIFFKFIFIRLFFLFFWFFFHLYITLFLNTNSQLPVLLYIEDFTYLIQTNFPEKAIKIWRFIHLHEGLQIHSINQTVSH